MADDRNDHEMKNLFRGIPPRHRALGAPPSHQHQEPTAVASKFKLNANTPAWAPSPGGTVPGINGVMTYNTLTPGATPTVQRIVNSLALQPKGAGVNDPLKQINALTACKIINSRVILALTQERKHQGVSTRKKTRRRERGKRHKPRNWKDPNLTNPNNPAYQGPPSKKWKKLKNAKMTSIQCGGDAFYAPHEPKSAGVIGDVPRYDFGAIDPFHHGPRRTSRSLSKSRSQSVGRVPMFSRFEPHSKPQRERRTKLVPLDPQYRYASPFEPKAKRAQFHRSKVPSRSPPPPPIQEMSVSPTSPSPADLSAVSSGGPSVLPPGFDKNSVPKTGTKRMAPAHANIQSVISANGGIFHPCHGYSTRDISIFDVFPGIVKYQSKRYSEWNRVEFLLSQSEKPFCGVNGRPLGVNEAEMWFVALKYLFNDITLGQFDYMTEEMLYIIRKYMATHKKRVVFLASIRRHGFLRVISDISKKLPREQIKKQMADEKRRRQKRILAKRARPVLSPPTGTFAPNVNPYLAIRSPPVSGSALTYGPPASNAPLISAQPPIGPLPPNVNPYASGQNGIIPLSAVPPRRRKGRLSESRSNTMPTPIVPRPQWSTENRPSSRNSTDGDLTTRIIWREDIADDILTSLKSQNMPKDESTPNLPPPRDALKNDDLSMFINAMEFVPSAPAPAAAAKDTEEVTTGDPTTTAEADSVAIASEESFP